MYRKITENKYLRSSLYGVLSVLFVWFGLRKMFDVQQFETVFVFVTALCITCSVAGLLLFLSERRRCKNSMAYKDAVCYLHEFANIYANDPAYTELICAIVAVLHLQKVADSTSENTVKTVKSTKVLHKLQPIKKKAVSKSTNSENNGNMSENTANVFSLDAVLLENADKRTATNTKNGNLRKVTKKNTGV